MTDYTAIITMVRVRVQVRVRVRVSVKVRVANVVATLGELPVEKVGFRVKLGLRLGLHTLLVRQT